MKVLMLGWEYPPHISGGLGTACHGLTTALARLGVEIDFVVPRFYGDEDSAHMRLWGALDGPAGTTPARGVVRRAPTDPSPPSAGVPREAPRPGLTDDVARLSDDIDADVERSGTEPGIGRIEVPAQLKPYLTPETYAQLVRADAVRRSLGGRPEGAADPTVAAAGPGEASGAELKPSVGQRQASTLSPAEPSPYSGDLFDEVERYARNVAAQVRDRAFDLVHAHDWLTWPAGVAIARAHGVPLLAHAHSLEFDRSGESADSRIFEVEQAGLRAADRVIAVSYYTRGLLHKQHGVPLDRITVVHNGVYSQAEIQSYRDKQPSDRKTVLFLGRVTFQKGPEYFVRAAAKVVPHVRNVEFVVAGSGDMLPAMIQQVAEMGLARYFRFTGFLKGAEVERMFSMADLYVMPSVSEPFGISALEAMSYDTPVIISKQSGVAEVLKHALKADFWDVDYLANLIIGALLYPELRADIVAMAREEVRQLHWDAAAEAMVGAYREVLGARGSLDAGHTESEPSRV